MRVTTLPQMYRNLKRWQEIIRVLRRYGLADWLSSLNVEFIRDWIKDERGVPLSSYSRPVRIRMALTALGPTFIKLGQVLSLRPDLVGPEIAEELQSLQTNVPADSPAAVRQRLAKELPGAIGSDFTRFDDQAIASASIGQVHTATLANGKSVVVKVQHVDIESVVHEDLDVLAGLAALAERIPELSAWQPTMLVEQLSRSLKRELSFSRELQNLLLFQSKFADFPNLRIPQPYPELSTSHVLTMERLEGRPLKVISRADKEAPIDAGHETDKPSSSQLSEESQATPNAADCSEPNPTSPSMLGDRVEDERHAEDGNHIGDTATIDDAPQPSNEQLARQIAGLYAEMIFEHGLYHADPHPGNILITHEGQLGLLDFGLVGRIDERLRETIEDMLQAVATRDTALLTSLVKRVGKVPPKLDDSQLSIDIEEIVSLYGAQPLESFDLSGALNDVTDILHRHRITLPSQAALLIKTLVTLQGTLNLLQPRFSLVEVLESTFRKMWIRRLSPARQLRKLRRIFSEVEGLVEKVPGQVSSLMDLVQEGRLDVHLSHRGLGPSVNRLVLGMLTSSLFLGSSVLMAYKVPPLLFVTPGPLALKDISVLGLIGVVISLLTGLRLLLAINKSGHLDPSAENED